MSYGSLAQRGDPEPTATRFQGQPLMPGLSGLALLSIAKPAAFTLALVRIIIIFAVEQESRKEPFHSGDTSEKSLVEALERIWNCLKR